MKWLGITINKKNMFKPHKFICIKCGHKRLIVVKKGLCAVCNDAEKRFKKGKPKFVAPIAKNSEKRIKLDALYKIINTSFLKRNPVCQVKDCGKPSVCTHHKKGRGEYYLDERTFLATCFLCHRKIEENPDWAKEEGYSESRLSKT